VPKPNCYLLKSDPEDYSLHDLERDGATLWDGVKNPQALQAIRAIRAQDILLIYHSGGESAIVGWAIAEQDAAHGAENEKLATVVIRFGGWLNSPVTLKEIKETGRFAEFALVRQGRLSAMAVPAEFVQWLKSLKRGFKA
jgi:predicted RNA-binding protein with PUA-like domain